MEVKTMKFEICKSTIVDDNMPMMKITRDDDRVGYLSPFRWYRFQVSGNMAGSGDYGSSPVIGLAKVLYAQYTSENDGTAGYQSNYYDTGAELLCVLAEQAIRNFDAYIPYSEIPTFGKYMNMVFEYLAKKLDKPVHVCDICIFEDEIHYCDE